jgi:uncharacterized membrane protein
MEVAMMWFGGNGWGSCGLIVNALAMAVFWGAVLTASLLAVHLLSSGRSNPPAMAVSGSTRAEGLSSAQFARTETDNDEFHKRLM